jgi:ABC-type cobalt transport system substrate-binding protein
LFFEGKILVKKTQIFGALLVGLLSVVAQIAGFYARFGKWNPHSTLLDYILFFVAGTLGGLILIYFLNRQNSKTAWSVTLLAFLLASPIAMVMMIGGGLLGSIGVLVYPQIPWTLFAWLGGVVGNFLAKK